MKNLNRNLIRNLTYMYDFLNMYIIILINDNIIILLNKNIK